MNNNINKTDTSQKPSLPHYSIKRLKSEEEIVALREEWKGLTETIPDCPFFLSWEWISTWWHYLRDDHELWLLTARDQDGHLAGIAPWVRSHRKIGPIAFRWLSFIGSGLARASHLDIVAQPREKEALSALFLQYLHDHLDEWDVLELEGLRQESPLASSLATAGGQCVRKDPVNCSFVSLPSSWETFQKECMTAKLRKTIRYYERRLEKHSPGKIVFQHVETEADLDKALEFMTQNSCRLFRQKGLESCFKNPAFRSFHNNIARVALENGFLRFYQLKVDDKIIAVQGCFRFKDIVYGYQTAFDPEWGKYSPGQQLLAYVFQEAIREKTREVDMMHGETDYKSSWASGFRQDLHLLYALNRRGKLWLLGVHLLNGMFLLSRKILPDNIRQAINRRLARKPS